MTDATEQLAKLVESGLTFGECVSFFAAQQDPRVKDVIEQARDEYARDGEVEIDDNAIISESKDGGDYVMAWVWVTRDDEEDED